MTVGKHSPVRSQVLRKDLPSYSHHGERGGAMEHGQDSDQTSFNQPVAGEMS
jgi:hypothetical protein